MIQVQTEHRSSVTKIYKCQTLVWKDCKKKKNKQKTHLLKIAMITEYTKTFQIQTITKTDNVLHVPNYNFIAS